MNQTNTLPGLVVTEPDLASALTEWQRRWREEPERFLRESEVLAESPESYGAAAGPYLMQILREQRGL